MALGSGWGEGLVQGGGDFFSCELTWRVFFVKIIRQSGFLLSLVDSTMQSWINSFLNQLSEMGKREF